MSVSATVRKPVGVRVTPEQYEVLLNAPRREHRTLSGFVVRAALEAADAGGTEPKRTREGLMAMIKAPRCAR